MFDLADQVIMKLGRGDKWSIIKNIQSEKLEK